MTDAEDNPVDVIFSAEVINKRVHELAMKSNRPASTTCL